MLTIILKYLFIFFFSIYICLKSLSIFQISLLENFIISFILSVITYLLSTHFEGVNYVFPLLLLWVVISKIDSNPQLSFVAIIISFTISFCFHAIASFIVIFLMVPFLNKTELLPLFALTSGVIQSFLIKGIFSIKRLRKGIPFLSSMPFINITTSFCLLFTGFILYISIDYEQFYIKLLVLNSFIIFLAFLIYWWQVQITKAYRRQLELRDAESLRIQNEELIHLNQKLKEDNERMAFITHRDNTLITTLKNSTLSYLRIDFEDAAEAAEVRDRLIANIEALSEGRSSLPEDYIEKKARNFDTGISLLDELLHQMDADAIKENISLSVHLGTSLKDFVPKDISESDLVHTVDDLLKNAFKATRTCGNRAVQLQFYKVGKYFVVEVADNGIPFEVKSLVNMGIERLTTYEDGSGIGLMDIWNTKENYRATYHLEEYATPGPFSKKISLTFDKKNRYSIRTWRKDEILRESKRVDLQIYDYSE